MELLVGRNSGGTAICSKLTAARDLRVPVIMIRRPDPEPGTRVETAEEALCWLAGHPIHSRLSGQLPTELQWKMEP